MLSAIHLSAYGALAGVFRTKFDKKREMVETNILLDAQGQIMPLDKEIYRF